jgi:hypothetical protein
MSGRNPFPLSGRIGCGGGEIAGGVLLRAPAGPVCQISVVTSGFARVLGPDLT